MQLFAEEILAWKNDNPPLSCSNSGLYLPIFYPAELGFPMPWPRRPEMVVGWYHSHPGFGCWFSGTVPWRRNGG